MINALATPQPFRAHTALVSLCANSNATVYQVCSAVLCDNGPLSHRPITINILDEIPTVIAVASFVNRYCSFKIGRWISHL